MTTRRSRRPLLAIAVAIAASAAALTGCGGGDEDAAGGAPTPQESGTLSAPDVTTTGAPPESGPAASSATAAGVAGEAGPAAAAGCPAAADVSAAWGAEMVLDEDAATTGAVGLVFCPYEEAVATGTTDAFGAEPLGDFFSITITGQNPVIEDVSADRVDGLGEQAQWYAGPGELSAWTGERGVIVSVPFPPDGVDAFALATTLAGLALGVDASAATATPADQEAVAAEAAEMAAGCPDAATVGGALGLDLQIGLGADAGEDEDGPYAFCPYELAPPGESFEFGVLFVIGPELSPIDAEAPSEDLTDYFGLAATWQDEYHVLLVEMAYGDVVIQITSNELDIDDREAALAVSEVLL